VQYKPVNVQTAENNVAPHKEVIGVIKQQNFTMEIHNYDVHIRNAGMEGPTTDQDTSVEVVVSQVEVGSLVGPKLNKSTKYLSVVDNYVVTVDDIEVGSVRIC